MNTPPKFDPTKPVQTRDGKPVRIVCMNRKTSLDDNTIIALIDSETVEYVKLYDKNGRCAIDVECLDLINIPEKRTIEFWLIIYKDGSINTCIHKEDTKGLIEYNSLACLHIKQEYTVGEGLNE